MLLLAVSLPSWWRETNSHASSARGSRAFAEKRYDNAAKAFNRAQQIAPSARNAFNLGTAEIAAGNREQGSAHLADAIQDPALRADALFNRGNSALESKAVDHAIRDYQDALRANPSHAAAKRNLEIALARRQNQRPAPGGKQGQQGRNPQQQQPQAPAPGQKPERGQADLEALLRSVQQQEQEELRRMKAQPAEGRVGW
ncbi:MAG TPA: tetratricopeptide repeat protein [Thermoanaerobaculia bacterium]|nr:tetratricopeptide repeat protein [Thermoanaerobaculia bacterium]